jgi:hypothetical protein
MYKIPFSIADAVANTEKDTGFDFPAKAIVLDRLHGLSVNVTTLDAGQNILFGILSRSPAATPTASPPTCRSPRRCRRSRSTVRCSRPTRRS